MFFENSTSLQVTTADHGVGPVDVVVTNTDGQAARLTGAFTYASPLSFDFNGTWNGTALAHPELQTLFRILHSDMALQFAIQNNTLATFTCGDPPETMTFSPPLVVSNGEFSFVRSDGVKISGRIVSPSVAVGAIDTLPCPATRWSAARQ